jgi:hypothetical protein
MCGTNCTWTNHLQSYLTITYCDNKLLGIVCLKRKAKCTSYGEKQKLKQGDDTETRVGVT